MALISLWHDVWLQNGTLLNMTGLDAPPALSKTGKYQVSLGMALGLLRNMHIRISGILVGKSLFQQTHTLGTGLLLIRERAHSSRPGM